MARAIHWFSDFKKLDMVVARAVVSEEEPRRYHVDVLAGLQSPPTELASSFESAKRRAEDMVLTLWPEARSLGWSGE